MTATPERAGGSSEPERQSAYRPGYEIAAEHILSYIAGRQLRPGDRMPTERELSERLNVSRTVTREALKVLAALGRVTVRKGAGIYVAEPSGLAAQQSWNLFLPADPDQVGLLFAFRRAIEGETSRLAASRATPQQVLAVRDAANRTDEAAAVDDFATFRDADDDFHQAVAAASNNPFFESTVVAITQLRRQVVTIGMRGDKPGSLLVAAKEHAAVAELIAAGEADGAVAAMVEHIDTTLDHYRRLLQRWMRGLAADNDRSASA
ncbi:FadR/GntR family transcriptional regulator [Jiangella asiatica]|uniref:FadR family transcriptional regulator n=1 Tax=Jiangella asiatica TaxID=2530372 RepID=A0A4V2Z0Y1_9ACTN|nr:FadR/GntR family transcriptional regulator [Jiangella asiatica]TDE02848.1 FadR family transcriptional regulator [Jiangella asiatica]